MTFPEILNLNYLVKKDADDEVKAEDADDEGTELGKADAGEDGSPAADSDVVEDVDQGVDIAGQAIDSDEGKDKYYQLTSKCSLSLILALVIELYTPKWTNDLQFVYCNKKQIIDGVTQGGNGSDKEDVALIIESWK